MGGPIVAAPGAPLPVLMELLHLEFGPSVEGRGVCRYLSPRGAPWCDVLRRADQRTRGTGSQDATAEDPAPTVATRRVAAFSRTQ